jgi:hypothetical protein
MNSELQTQTDLLLKALSQLHGDALMLLECLISGLVVLILLKLFRR